VSFDLKQTWEDGDVVDGQVLSSPEAPISMEAAEKASSKCRRNRGVSTRGSRAAAGCKGPLDFRGTLAVAGALPRMGLELANPPGEPVFSYWSVPWQSVDIKFGNFSRKKYPRNQY
jgi:hypothetical protein